MTKTITFFCFFSFSLSVAQNTQTIINAFDSASQEFGVPADVLKGIAFAETRWQQLTWADGDTASCVGMPHPYGIMSLWDNQYFGHSLTEAAHLIGEDPSVLKSDMVQNIRGAAALLKQYHEKLPLPAGTSAAQIESWRNAIARYSGLPQVELAQQHALDIYTEMSKGYHQFHIDWNAHPVNLAPMREAVRAIQKQAELRKSLSGESVQSVENQPDYPLAKWAPSYPGHWYTTGNTRSFVVIHDMEGYYLAVIAYFQMATTQASIYYCVNGLQDNASDAPAGEITQMVEEKYWAWHVRCWNPYMFGIEHEGFVSNPAWFTEDMYRSSAQLTAYLCNKYNIPKDRNHIIGHNEWQNPNWTSWMGTNFPMIDVTCNDHTDPGQYWNWSHYMSLVTAVRITSTYPSANALDVPAYKDIVVQFNSSMDSASVVQAFSLTPAASGTFSWSENYSTLRFHPDSLLQFNTVYNITIDSTARDEVGGRSLSGADTGTSASPFHLSFTTVPIDTIPPVLTQYYPESEASDFPATASAVIFFNEPLQSSSVAGKVSVTDSLSQTLPSVSITVDSTGGTGTVTISSPDFEPGAEYTLSLQPGIADYYGNTASTGLSVHFRTNKTVVTEGTVFDPFENRTRPWIQPGDNSSSTLYDPAATQFSYSSERVKSGSFAGKLEYAFTQNLNGSIVLEAGTNPILDSYSSIGLWVYGDGSGNEIDFTFLPQHQVFAIDTIDWWGWKFLSVSLAGVTGPSKKFDSFVVLQRPSAGTSGVLYLDNLQVNPVATIVAAGSKDLPARFGLFQNYPNPFNPSTIIQYQIPVDSHVRLVAYNILGQLVRVLINENKSRGSYTYTFDGTGLPSGVYFYKLEASGYHDVQKMLLIR